MALRTDDLAATSAPVAVTLPHPATGVPARSSAFAALGYLDFRYLLACNVSWQLGFWVLTIAQGWLVFDLTNSPWMLGLVGFASGAPMLFVSPLGGAIADRMDRKKVLFGVQVGHVVIGLTQAVLALGGWIQVWHIMGLALTAGTISCVSMPARQTLALDLVGKKHLPNAIGLNSIGQNAIRVLGPAVGGILIGAMGVTGAFFFQVGCVALGAFFVLMIRSGAQTTELQRSKLLESITEGIRYGWQERNIRAVLIVAGISTIFGLSYSQLMPAFAKDVLGMGPTGYGLLMAASGVGALAGSMYVVMTSDAPRKGRVLIMAQFGLGASLLLFALSRFIPLSFIFLAGVGIGSAVWMAISNTLLQTYCAREYQGRVMALYLMTFGLQTGGSLVAGALADVIGVPWTFGSSAAVVVALSLYMIVVNRRVWRL